MSKPEPNSEAVREVKEAFLALIEILGFISNDEVFKKVHGFSMTEFIELRYSCGNKIRAVADDIDRVIRDTGIARTTGGAVAVAAGAAAIGGILLAPFTAGFSLALTVGGVAGGIASAVTTIGTAIAKDQLIKSHAKDVKNLLDSLKDKDEVVNKVIKKLQAKIKKVRALYNKPGAKEIMEDAKKLTQIVVGIGYSVIYQGHVVYKTVEAVRFANSVAQFIQADIYAMRGIAAGMAAPGLSIFGKTLIVAGSSAAKLLSGAFAVFGIGLGLWDIIGGAMDIYEGVNGSEHAKAYRKAANDLDKHTDSIDELVKKIKIKDDDDYE